MKYPDLCEHLCLLCEPLCNTKSEIFIVSLRTTEKAQSYTEGKYQ